MEELKDLIEGCKSGRQKAQSELYQMFAPKLFGVCIRYSRDMSEAEDILHEAFMKIFNRIRQYNGKGSLEGWLTRIVVNLALDKYKKRYRLHTVEDITVYDYKNIDESAYSTMDHAQILELVQQLPPRYKVVFNLYAIDGYSHREIAEMLGVSESTSKSNLSRARKVLQEKLFDLGFIEKEYAK